MAETVTGVVDGITYHDSDSGYCVLSIVPNGSYPKAEQRDGTVVVVGVMPDFSEGETAEFRGSWNIHQRYGMRFNAEQAILALPKTEEEIIKYLSGGQFKGIGPGTAERIVAHFGEATIDVLDEAPERLYAIPSVKPAVIDFFLEDWSENHLQRHTLAFLQGELGINARVARRIYGKYGDETRLLVKEDPYLLAIDELLGFGDADKIAKKLGIAEDHSGRFQAGFVHTLHSFARQGHTFAQREGAVAEAGNYLGIEDKDAMQEALTELLNEETIVAEEFDPGAGRKPVDAVYLPRYWHAESSVAEKLRSMAMRSSKLIHSHRGTDWSKFLDNVSSDHDLQPSSEQLESVKAALTSKVSVLTGGPGTGKTAALRMLIDALRSSKCMFHLAAPTGRAARRLAEATGNSASTIHRLLKWDPETGRFSRNEGSLLATDIVVIDEASMLELLLFDDLLKAMPVHAHLLLVGDVDQLPSVGAGNVLSDVMGSDYVNVTRLRQIYRQDDTSHIVRNAHDINQGSYPHIDNNRSSDFFLFRLNDSERVADMVVDLVTNRIPKKWPQYSPSRDIQVMAPMHDGIIGVNNLNNRLQQELMPYAAPATSIGRHKLRVGDKVMQLRNDYDKEVFNGDIGFIKSVDSAERTLQVRFQHVARNSQLAQDSDIEVDESLAEFLNLPKDSDLIKYQFSELHNLKLAYCITIHKSQGSEFPVVVLPVHSQHSRMLQRNLLYTAITRATQLVVLVGTHEALERAIDNHEINERNSGLPYRLRA